MNRILISILIFFLSTTSAVSQCKRIFRKGYSKLEINASSFSSNSDTIMYNEARFHCVYSSLKLKHLLFKKFGRWDEIILNQATTPLLVWKSTKLSQNDPALYTLVASGSETRDEVYTSIMVFEGNSDVLNDNHPRKDEVIAFFDQLLHQKSKPSPSFDKAYWPQADPEKWKVLKKKYNY